MDLLAVHTGKHLSRQPSQILLKTLNPLRWLASKYETKPNRHTLIVVLKVQLSILVLFALCAGRLLDNHTLCNSLLVSFERISRGTNSRQINRQGVEYLKALIKSAGAWC